MQFTFPDYYKEFSCIAGDCPDTCCAGWQIIIDDKSLKKYRHLKGAFRNRLHNGIDWKEHSFRQHNKRCEFLNEKNLCDIYKEAGRDMLCDTCRKYPRHVEEFEGLREISLSLSCPEAARIILERKEKVTFPTIEKPSKEEIYDDFDYILFTALTDARDKIIHILQNREIPMKLRLWKVLAYTHDLQLSIDKNELFRFEDIRKRHDASAFGASFISKAMAWNNNEDCALKLLKNMWQTLIPEMEVLREGWHEFLQENLQPLYDGDNSQYLCRQREFALDNPDWDIWQEQLLVYWVFTYFCGAVYDEMPFAKIKLAFVSTLMIRDLAVGTFLKQNKNFRLQDMIYICRWFSRELEHSDQNLNRMEELLSRNPAFSFRNLIQVCDI